MFDFAALQPPGASCFPADQPKRLRTGHVRLVVKLNDGHCTKNSEEPLKTPQLTLRAWVRPFRTSLFKNEPKDWMRWGGGAR